MTILVTAAGVAFLYGIVMLLSYRQAHLFIPLVIGASLRLLTSFIGFYGQPIRLPYTQHDASAFERRAAQIADAGWGEVLSGLNPFLGFDVAAPFAVIYFIVGREPHALLLYNVTLGVFTIWLVARTAAMLVGKRAETAAAYLMALFPAAILMSSIILREAAVMFGIALALWGLLSAGRSQTIVPLIAGAVGLLWATLHHGGVLGVSFLVLLTFTLGQIRKSYIDGSVKVSALSTAMVSGLLLSGLAVVLLSGSIRLPSVGILSFEVVEAELISVDGRTAWGESSYYGGRTTSSWGEAVRQLPGRVTLFVLSPLPWTVRSLSQVAGLIDALAWGLISLFLLRRRAQIWANPDARLLLLVLACGVIVYALGTTNAGTALRHRTKFAPALVLLTILVATAPIPLVRRRGRQPRVGVDGGHVL